MAGVKVAAVRPIDDDGRGVFLVDVASHDVFPDQTVEVAVEGPSLLCRVMAGPHQIIQAAWPVVGRITNVIAENQPSPIDVEGVLNGHPSSRFPGLGTSLQTGRGIVRVLSLDVPNGVVEVQLDSGETDRLDLGRLEPDVGGTLD